LKKKLWQNPRIADMTSQSGLGIIGIQLTWAQRGLGRQGKRQPPVYHAVFWILRTGAPWRDLPPDYGDWKNTHRRFCRWRDKGVWEALLEKLVTEPDFEWLMIDASHIKVHPHAAGAKGGNRDIGVTKGGSTARYTWPWMRMVCQSEYLLQQVPLQIVHRLQP
jgi:transposase